MTKKKLSTFGILYLAYIALIVIGIIALFFYVRGELVAYENSVPEKYAEYVIVNASENDGALGEYMQNHCFSGDAANFGDAANRKETFYKRAKGDLEVSIDKRAYKSNEPVYTITSNGKPYMTIALSQASSRNSLGILTISEWNIEYAVLRQESSEGDAVSLDENGVPTYSYSASSSMDILVDGVAADLSNAEKSEDKDLSAISKFVDVPKANKLVLTDMAFEPVFSSAVNAEKANKAKSICDSLNPIEMAKSWSLFMLGDLEGKQRGFETALADCRLLDGTDVYNMAYSWAHSIDITFVSVHTFNTWSDESVSNYTMYSDTLVSCDVCVNANITLKTGAKRVQGFNNRMYFAKVTSSETGLSDWYLVDMMDLTVNN